MSEAGLPNRTSMLIERFQIVQTPRDVGAAVLIRHREVDEHSNSKLRKGRTRFEIANTDHLEKKSLAHALFGDFSFIETKVVRRATLSSISIRAIKVLHFATICIPAASGRSSLGRKFAINGSSEPCV